MIVIIEGLDAVGKTTICKKIAEQYDFQYIKESYTDSNEEKLKRMTDMFQRLTENKNYIYDRTTLIDDFVYGFLNKQQSCLAEYYDIILRILSHCTIIHLQLDEQTQKERLKTRGDEYINEQNVDQIDKNYRKVYEDIYGVMYITLTTDLKKDVQKIMEVIENEN